MKRWLRLCVAAGLLLAASCALGSYHTFRIEQIYSNADGSVQFIVFTSSRSAVVDLPGGRVSTIAPFEF